MVPQTNRVMVRRYILGLTFETKNFAFEVKVLLVLESTFPDGLVDKIGLNGPAD